MQAFKRLQAISSQHDTKALALQQALRDAAHGDGVINHHDKRDLRSGSNQGEGLDGIATRCLQHVRFGAVTAQGTGLVTVNRRQRHRVVNQYHGTRCQHRHACQTRQTRQLGPKIFNHHLLVAQHLVHVQSHALRGASEDHDRCCLALHFCALAGRLEQCT